MPDMTNLKKLTDPARLGELAKLPDLSLADLDTLTGLGDDLGELTAEVANLARDAAYVMVGLGVLAFQRAQVARVELRAKLGGEAGADQHVNHLVEALTRRVHDLDELVERAVTAVENSLEPLQEQLPPAARDLTRRAQDQAREVRSQIRARVVPAA